MPTDIRLSIGFFTHPKTRKLRRALGDEGVLCLLQLWCYVATNRPRGNLDGLDTDDIEIAADWQGEQGAFFARLVSIGWIEQCEDDKVGVHWCIHDWAEHNPWVYAAPERSQAARNAINARWDKAKRVKQDNKLSYDSNTERIRGVYEANTHSNTDSYGQNDSVIPLSSPLLSSPFLSSPNLSSPNLSYPNQTNHDQLSDESLTHAHERVGARVGVREALNEQFDAWWSLYPGKGSKAAARKAWDRLVKSDTKASAILSATRDQVERHTDLSKRGSWVPLWRHGSTWLNQAGWDDDPIPERIDRQGSRADTNRTALAAWMGGT